MSTPGDVVPGTSDAFDAGHERRSLPLMGNCSITGSSYESTPRTAAQRRSDHETGSGSS